MAPYIVTFAFITFASYYAEKKLNRAHTKLFVFLSILIVLVPSILAGCRDYSIGTDINIYVIPTFQQAQKFNSLPAFLVFNASWYKSVDTLFAVLTYIITRFTDNAHWLLFAISLIINGFFYAGWVRLRRFAPIWLGVLVMSLMYYNQSYNVMRQSIAAAIVFFAISYLLENKSLKYFGLLAIAFFFHNSAIIGLLFWFIYKATSGISKQSKIFVKSAIILAVCGLFIFLPEVAQFAVSLGILPQKYLKYVLGNTYGSGFSVTLLAFSTVKFGFVLIHRRPLMRRLKENAIIFIYAILDFLVAFLKIYSPYTNRLELFTGPVFLILMVQLPSIYGHKHKCDRTIMALFIVGFATVYWIYIYIYHGYYMTYPYVFNIAA